MIMMIIMMISDGLGCMGTRVHGYKGTWVHGYKGTWVHGYKGTWVYIGILACGVSKTMYSF